MRGALLHRAEGQSGLRAGVSNTVAKLARSRGEAAGLRAPAPENDPDNEPEALVLTDGAARWSARLIEIPGGESLLLFRGEVPPPDADLAVARSPRPRTIPTPRDPLCFAAGTLIDTPHGPRPVEALSPGDRVATRDDGPAEILWTGRHNVSARSLAATPGLCPVRLRAGAMGNAADLIVSPGHRLLLAGRGVAALWTASEVLVRAADLIDGRAIVQDHAVVPITYVHLLLRRHHVLRANGAWAESFDPGAADLTSLDAVARRGLLDMVPGIDRDASAYGSPARRRISGAELAILRHPGVPRHLA